MNIIISIESIQIDDNSYYQLIHFLRNETKIHFEYYRRNFVERRIKARMIRVNCRTLNEYHNYILSNPGETEKFNDSFNINYSYFFRNFEVFEKFQEIFLEGFNFDKSKIFSDLSPNPERSYKRKEKNLGNNNINNVKKVPYDDVIKSNRESANLFLRKASGLAKSNDLLRNDKRNEIKFLTQTSLYKKVKDPRRSEKIINIWSCPSASGEEPYSIAMILNNLKKQIPLFPKYRINASDIDAEAIGKAKIGIYKDDSMRDMSDYFINNYFIKSKEIFGNKFKITDEIKNDVNFIKEDITQGHQESWKYDVIFCRYLLIYFNREKRDRFLKLLENKLAWGGLLILGKTETLFNSFSSFKLVDSRNHIYIKNDSNTK